jgi:hypothetical protein
MTAAPIRSLLAGTAVAAVMIHGLSGHGLPQSSHDGMVGATAGACLLLATALAYATMPPPGNHTPVLWEAAAIVVSAPPDAPLDGRARASPSALQRFRN